MSASRPGNMSGPWVKTPLLLLLLLLITLTGTVLCQTESDDADPGTEAEDEAIDDESLPTVPDSTLPPDQPPAEDPVAEEEDGASGGGRSSVDVITPTGTEGLSTLGYDTTPAEGEENLGLIIIPILVVLVVVIIGMIVCGIVIQRKWTNKTRNQELRKEDPYLDGSSTEKVPMPMFEEDVPSVLELEMEELDQWMKKDG
ncbi:putative transmembrane protein 154 isoform 2 [Scophthalmus maximus]|nr:transmembrane protein 154 isoform X3 [Scophthalmus maximus]AWP05408.1 putative transmembrane protein 154 isoform 2 [Scophthalmus maximus]